MNSYLVQFCLRISDYGESGREGFKLWGEAKGAKSEKERGGEREGDSSALSLIFNFFPFVFYSFTHATKLNGVVNNKAPKFTAHKISEIRIYYNGRIMRCKRSVANTVFYCSWSSIESLWNYPPNENGVTEWDKRMLNNRSPILNRKTNNEQFHNIDILTTPIIYQIMSFSSAVRFTSKSTVPI